MRLARTLLVLLVLGGSAPIALADSPSAEDTRKQARTHFRAGTVFYEAGNYDRAIEEYLAAYKLLPLPDLLFNLAQAYRLKGELREAIDYYRRYLAVRPNDAPAVEARQTLRTLEEAVAKLPPPKVDAPPAPEPAPPVVVIATSPQPPPSTRRQRRWVWGVVGASIVVVAGVGLGLGIGLGTRPQNPKESLGSAEAKPQ